jgi:DNA mismatch endonuclease (patch repair protein)
MDTLSVAERSERMARVKGKDSKPELHVRRMIHGMGFRYRLHDKRLPGKPDLVFASRKKVIFVHGCFWHRHPDPKCPLARMPKSKLDFWKPKLEANRERDLRQQKALEAMGWQFLVVWECELRHEEQLRNKMQSYLEEGSQNEGD